eukprot:s200_g21.t1
MLVDIEALYGEIDEYLTGGAYDVGAAEMLESPQLAADMEAEPEANAAPAADETEFQRGRRYQESPQDEVSDPDEWAERHYGGLEWDNYQRMIAFSRANRLRLQRALHSLQARREAAEFQGNWEEAAEYTRAMAEVQNLMDIA